MHTTSISFCLSLIFCSLLIAENAQGQSHWWNKLDSSDLMYKPGQSENISTSVERYIQIDFESLRKNLKIDKNAKVELEVPIVQDSYEVFVIWEYTMMEKALQEKFPEIKTFRGYAKSRPDRKIRIDINKKAAHFTILGPGLQLYIDPALRPAGNQYIIYKKEECKEPQAMVCQYHQKIREHEKPSLRSNQSTIDRVVREYRLAVSASYAYTQFFGGTVEGALGGIVTSINRVNMVYERDLSIRMKLVADNDTLIITDPDALEFTTGIVLLCLLKDGNLVV